MTTKSKIKTKQVAFRIEPALVKRLDAHAERLSQRDGGVLKYTRIDALRSLLIPALDAAEKADVKRGGKS